jgi:hypothetical protein
MDENTTSHDDYGIRVASFNLHGFKNSWSYLHDLLLHHDVVFVQEIMEVTPTVFKTM